MPRYPVLSRRTALGGVAAAAAAMLAGCTSDDSRKATRTPSPRHSPATDPDVRIAAVVLAHERAMLDRIAATVKRHPKLASTLVSTLAAHRAHVALLTRAVPNNTPLHSLSRGAEGVPRRADRALLALAAAEQRLSDRDAHNSLKVRSGPFARVLASMSAAAAQQNVHLAAAGAERA